MIKTITYEEIIKLLRNIVILNGRVNENRV